MSKYLKPFLVCVCLAVLVVPAGVASAFEAFDDTLVVGGFLRNDSAWRLGDGDPGLHGPDPRVGTQEGLDAGDYVMSRNTLQLEGTWSPLDNFSLTAIWRGVYEASLQLDDDLEQNVRDAGAGHRIDDYEYDSDLREVFVDVTMGDWHIRAGKQQIVWGEALGFRMSDIINPLDYSWHYIFPDWEDIRIPLWAFNISHPIFSPDYVLEFVWLPGIIDTGFQGTKFGTAGTNWGPAGFGQLFLDDIRRSMPDEDISNSEFGARLKAMLGKWDTSLFWFYSREDNPFFEEDWVPKFLGGDNEFFQFPFNNKIGATFNVYSEWADAVFRGECVFTIDEHYNQLNTFTNPHKVFEKNTFAYMVAMDKLLKIPFISERNFVYVSMQLEQKYIIDFDDRMTTYDMAQDDTQTIVTLYIDTKYFYEKLTPSLFLMYNMTGEAWARPQITYDLNDYWSFGVGAQLMDASSTSEPFFGGVQDNDEIYFFAKLGF